MHIGITTKQGLKDPEGIISRCVEHLKKLGVKVDLCEWTCNLSFHEKPALNFNRKYDFLLVFGGDGSLLRTIQHMKHFETPIMLLNMGRLGFFSEELGKHYLKIMDRIVEGKYHVDLRNLLRCTVKRNGRRAVTQRALNEVTIARDALARMVSLKVTVDDLKLTRYIADGLIIATPTGSTGYSISAGGPIVSPQLEAVILTPIAPHTFTHRPIVISDKSRIKIHLSRSGGRVYLTIDGQRGFHLRENDIVQVKRSTKSVRLARLGKNSYFQTLRKKLHWGRDLVTR